MLLWQALIGLIAYDALNAACSFRTLHSLLKNCLVSTHVENDDAIERVCAAVNHACIWYPKRALCLQRAFVTTWLLRKHGVNALMVLGAQRLPFKAHAWVEVDGKAINERTNVQATYAVWERC
jgi:Transglutaminase-like superfamily